MESAVRAVGSFPKRARGTSVPGADAIDRGFGRSGGGGVHPSDGASGVASLSTGKLSVEASAGAGRGLAGDGLSAVPLLSGCARQRSATNQGGIVRTGRTHHALDRVRKILLHVSDVGKWNSAGSRRARSASRWWNRVGTRKNAGLAARKSEIADSCRRCGSGCRGL